MNKSDFFTADAVKPHFTYDDYCESADMIASHLGDFRPEVLLVLGSGLGFLGDRVEARTCVSYADIPHFRASTAPGHEGRFVFGELRGKRVAVMQGRMHCYEGYTMEDAAYAVRVIRLLGAKTMIVTNAAGAVNTDYQAGDLMLISDHIKLFDFGPLWGPNIDEFGTRFPDMSNVYSPRLRELAKEVAREQDLTLREGVYMYFPGPQFETPAEVRAAMGELMELSGIRVRGLMTMAPRGDQDIARRTFRGLRELRDELERDHGVALPELSCGMSEDFEVALEEGSTIVRLGRVVFDPSFALQ